MNKDLGNNITTRARLDTRTSAFLQYDTQHQFSSLSGVDAPASRDTATE